MMSSGRLGGSPGLLRRLRLLRAQNRYLTPRRIFNYLLVQFEMKRGRSRLISRPYHLCIDVSNRCNLECPFCPTGRREEGRAKGSMSYEMFTSIVDDLAPYLMTLQLFNWGEAFFNPELPRLIGYAYRRRLVTMISSNLSFRLKEDQIRAVIRGGLTYLTASVDGADQESYEVYRRGGKFDLVVENLRAFVRLRREMKSEFPRLCWQYLIFAHNEGRVAEARELAAALGLERFSAMGGIYEDESWAPAGDYSFPYLDMCANRCPWLWNKAVFHWDGGLASCCMGFYKHDDFAQWKPGTFGALWNNEKFVAARRIWTEPASALPPGHFCAACDKVRFFRGLPIESKMKPPPALRKEAAA